MKPYSAPETPLPVHGNQPGHGEQAPVPFKDFKPYSQPACGVPGMDILGTNVAGGVKEFNIQFTMGAGHVPASPSVQFSSVTNNPSGADAGYGGNTDLNTPMLITVPIGDTFTITAWITDSIGTGALRNGPHKDFILSAA